MYFVILSKECVERMVEIQKNYNFGKQCVT